MEFLSNKIRNLKKKISLDVTSGDMMQDVRGFSLLELALAVGLFMIFAVGLASTAIGGYLSNLENELEAKANALLVESWEALRAIQNNGWSAMVNGDHGIAVSGGHWEFSGSSDEIDGFTRIINISDVQRDPTSNIVTFGGDVDSDSKKITLTLSWVSSANQPRSLELESYMTNYVNPEEWPIPPPAP